MMVRTYGQWCALARALDAVGERWALLIVRELLDGPKRYTDLRNGVPGISTDMLASRLKGLEAWGVLQTRVLPPPAAARVYELTQRGRELAPVLGALAHWGVPLLSDGLEGEVLPPQGLALVLRGMLNENATADVRIDIDFDLGSDVIRIRVVEDDLAVIALPDHGADVVVRADLGTLAAIAQGSLDPTEAVAHGRLRVSGSRDARRTYARLFSSSSVLR